MSKANKIISIGIDQGTSGTTVLAVDEKLQPLTDWYKPHTQYRPQSGFLEHDPDEILNIVIEGVANVLEQLDINAGTKLTAGLANQGETVCAWDSETGKPLYNAIVWSDCRGGEFIGNLSASEKEEIKQITGLEPDSYFSAGKIAWLLNNVPQIKSAMEKGRLTIGTLDSWLIWKLSDNKVYYTDPSTAARTMLYDITAGKWSDAVLKLMGMPKLPLAKVLQSTGNIAALSHPCWNIDSLLLNASIVDQPASLFAHGCWKTGQAKITYGTGCFLLVNIGKTYPANNNGGLTISIGWDIGEGTEYIVDGAVYATGSVIEWLNKDCGWIKKTCEIDKMISETPVQDTLFFVPCMDGLSAPYWNRNVKGLLSGVTLATKPAHIIRAALDGIAHQVVDIVDSLPKYLRIGLHEIRVDGGLSGSNYLMQKQADLLGIPIVVTDNPEMTALGAAAMAMIGASFSTKDEIFSQINSLTHKTFSPALGSQQRLTQRNNWKQAVKLAISAADLNKQENR